jgi:hypothetical protein
MKLAEFVSVIYVLLPACFGYILSGDTGASLQVWQKHTEGQGPSLCHTELYRFVDCVSI